MSIFQKEQAKYLLELLRSAHAVQYAGLDDDMADDCNDWIGNLEDDELCDIVLKIYHDGI